MIKMEIMNVIYEFSKFLYENRKIKFEQILEQSKEEIKVFAEEFLKNKPLPEMKPERIKEIIYGLFIEEKTLGEV